MIDIASLKGMHQGKRAFLLGNGPSLSKTPLHLLDGEINFSMNNISDVFQFTTWRPQYYYNTAMQIFRFREWFDKAEQAIAECHLAFVRRDSPVKRSPNVCEIEVGGYACKYCHHAIPKYSLDCDKLVTNYRMSLWGMSQIALFMGITKVYFLGCDLGFQPTDVVGVDPNHFSDDYGGSFYWSQYLARRENFYHHEGHRLLRDIFKEYGIEGYNATVGGELEIWPRVDIHEVLKTREQSDVFGA